MTEGYESFSIAIEGRESGGVIEARLGPVPAGYEWEVERIMVRSTSSTTTTALIYLGSVSDENVVDGTNNGDLDVADNNMPIRIPQGQSLILRWTGASAAAIGRARVQYVARQTYSSRGVGRAAPKPKQVRSRAWA